VFRAVSPACSCDLVFLSDFGPIRVEVRTGVRGATGTISFPWGSKDHGKSDVTAVVLSDEIIYYSRVKIPGLDVRDFGTRKVA
jgi:hypothetical protein